MTGPSESTFDPFLDSKADFKLKPLPEVTGKLNPKGFPELKRPRTKYVNKRRGLYILAHFIRIDDDHNRINWSLYVDDKAKIGTIF